MKSISFLLRTFSQTSIIMRYSLSILFFCCCALWSSGQETPDFLSDYMKKWENAEAYTLQVAELMPESSYDFKPTEDQMTFRRQLVHLSNNIAWLSSTYLGAERPEQDLRGEIVDIYTKTEVLDILKVVFGNARAALEQLQPETLNEEVEFFAGPMTRRRVLFLMTDHITHHRAQAIIYLRLEGVDPPKYVGW